MPDDVWADFRDLAGSRPVAILLGELVTREVRRHRFERLRGGQLDDREVLEALARAREQQADLTAIVERLERLRRAEWDMRA